MIIVNVKTVRTMSGICHLFLPPLVSCAAENQPVSNIKVEERFGGGRGGGFGLGVAKV
jgi:hypothetical protein